MSLPISKSQIEKLGQRLVASSPPAREDLSLLRGILLAYDEVLNQVVQQIQQSTNHEPTPRLKNTGTILEKLHRHGGSWLKSIQDLAGLRIVGDFNRAEQDRLAERLAGLFADEPRSPKIVNRKLEPSNGYRAVHIIVFPDGIPVEIQIRTRMQHTWADLFEKMADKFGRGIRYGEQPQHWLSQTELTQGDELDNKLYKAAYEYRCAIVSMALTLADWIDAVEDGELEGPHHETVVKNRQQVQYELDELRSELKGHVGISEAKNA